MVFLFINYLQTCSLFMLSLFMHIKNRIGIVMVSLFVSSVGSSSDWVRPNTMKLAFVASPLKMQHSGERAQTGWFGNRIMCPAVCGFYQDFLDRGLLLSRKLPNQGFLLVKLKSSPRRFYSRHHDLVEPLWNICVTNEHGYVLLVANTSRCFRHSWICDWINTTGATSGTGNAYPSGAPAFTPGF
jgi:hypothetical protein